MRIERESEGENREKREGNRERGKERGRERVSEIERYRLTDRHSVNRIGDVT